MARPACSNCGQYEAAMILTSLDNGEAMSPCGNCIPGTALSMAAFMTQGMSAEECEEYGDLFDKIAANDQRPPKPATKQASKRKKQPPATDAPEVTPSPDPAAPAPDAMVVGHAPPDGPQTAETTPVELDPPCDTCRGVKGTGDATTLTCDGCGAVIAVRDPEELSGVS